MIGLQSYTRVLSLFCFLTLLWGTAGCKKIVVDVPQEQEAMAVARAAQIAPSVEGPQLAGPPTVKLADDKKKKKKTDEDDEVKDYWKEIDFDLANLEEVREYVRTYYIDDTIDENRALAEGCTRALLTLDEPRQLLPVRFHKLRKAHPDEDGMLKGKTYRINPADSYLVHVLPKLSDKDKKKRKKRLTDDEIRAERKKMRVRAKLLDENWKAIKFGESDFRACVAHAVVKNRKQKKPLDVKKYHVAATRGYLYSLDPHSDLVSAKAWAESTQAITDSSFEGIGAILTKREDNTVVESPLEGRPAFIAGLRAGDIIVKVDGKEIGGMLLSKVVKKIRGPKGTVVALTVTREGEAEELVIKITRAHIEVRNVSYKMVPHHKDIGYVKLTGFVEKSTAFLEEAVATLEKKTKSGRLRGLIFDLRNNSGGLLDQGVQIADHFIARGRLVTVKNRVRRDEPHEAHAAGTWKMPLIVLVNDGSASASEIVASAIQDHQRGLIVGDRTFGKASVQTLFNPILRKDYYIKLTIARYYSPSGRTIQVVGVAPDLEVAPNVDGKMPLGFREENLSHYLKPIVSNYKSPNHAVAKTVQACAKKRGIAEKVHTAEPNPQIRFDFQMMKGADFLECYIDELSQARVER